jgi:hypothetical protein
MRVADKTLVVVQGEWDGWRRAEICLSDLTDIHWRQPNRAPRPVIHARVLCSKLVAGEIPHGCDSTPPPHELLVCVMRRHTAAWVHRELVRRATSAAGAGFDPTSP